ncbi:hypothetical protein IEQ34_026202 [Dendrobium chrysotoxum]|uniref:Uncharacterized protein n=1 Tax=Dendrobium chrysotoxum TaxID=161865 RepID=A0AAV7FMY8_DENCH|nr:hypothetical protein IEQ34_026202 [Dendrobium chrysotoxum]
MSTTGRGRHSALGFSRAAGGAPDAAQQLLVGSTILRETRGNQLLDGSISLSRPIPESDERFARQYRCGPPPEFPLASPRSGIVHHLSGPDTHAHTRTLHKRSGSVGGAPVKEDPAHQLPCAHRASTPVGSHACQAPWSVFQDGSNGEPAGRCNGHARALEGSPVRRVLCWPTAPTVPPRASIARAPAGNPRKFLLLRLLICLNSAGGLACPGVAFKTPSMDRRMVWDHLNNQRDDYPLLSPPCRGARGATVHIRAIASPSIDGWLDTERRSMDFSQSHGRRTARITAIRTLHRTIQSVGATGGVYKGQGRSQRELMTRAY